jgi:hypothetical protein
VLDFLAKAVRQAKEIKVIPIRKEEVKLFLFADNMILYLKDPKDSIKRACRVTQVVEHLPSKCEALSSYCSTTTKTKQEKSTKKLLKLINTFSKIGYKTNIQKTQ